MTCYSAYQLANFMDVWLFAGLCTRLSTPLGLNHLSAWDFSTNRSGPLAEDWGQRIRHAKRRDMLGPANYLEEHWERSVTFWMAFTIDRFASAITDLSTSIDESECLLPVHPRLDAILTLFAQRTSRRTCRASRLAHNRTSRSTA